MRYEINEQTNEVSVYDDNEVRFLSQPTWPDGTDWSSKVEAETWATQYMLSMTDKAADLAGPSPTTPTIARPKDIDPLEVPGLDIPPTN